MAGGGNMPLWFRALTGLCWMRWRFSAAATTATAGDYTARNLHHQRDCNRHQWKRAAVDYASDSDRKVIRLAGEENTIRSSDRDFSPCRSGLP